MVGKLCGWWESRERAGRPANNSSICQSQSTCRFQLAHHAVLHRPWPNHTNTEKIQRLIIYRFLEENGFLVPHRKFLDVVPITKHYHMSWLSAAACGVHALLLIQGLSGLKYGCHLYEHATSLAFFSPLLVKPMSFLPNFCAWLFRSH